MSFLRETDADYKCLAEMVKKKYEKMVQICNMRNKIQFIT